MKELSIEEKAKAYDEAIEKAKYYQKENGSGVISAIFPELAEPEDDRIRNEIIAFVIQSIHRGGGTPIPEEKENKWIAWLEKQGEPKEYTFKSLPRLLDMIEPTNKAKEYCQKLIDILIQEGYGADAKIVDNCLKQMNGEKVAMATGDEQKPAWSEDDRIRITNCIQLIGKTGDGEVKWLKSLENRILPRANQEWSEEDEKFFKTVLWHISYSISNGESTDIQCDTTEWLKSLKQKLKGE